MPVRTQRFSQKVIDLLLISSTFKTSLQRMRVKKVRIYMDKKHQPEERVVVFILEQNRI